MSSSVSVRVTPSSRTLFDEPVCISVGGLHPQQEVTLRVSLTDETGVRFQSRARYRAGPGGELDLTRCPSLGGSFTGLEPMGLLWALEADTPHRRLVKKDVQTPFRLELEVHEGHGDPPGELLGRGTHERGFLREGVLRTLVREGRLRATLFQPPGPGPFPGIIDIYGTGGGLPEYRASLLANHGFATLALAYYGYEDLPKQMKEFALEYFEEAVNYMLQHPQVKGPGVGVIGTGKGADLALSMITFLPEVVAAISISGCCSNTAADLHYDDKILLPGLRFSMDKVSISESGVFDVFESLGDPTDPENSQCFIPIEEADGHFLFVVGEDDRNWNSSLYAQLAMTRLKEHGKDNFLLLSYPGTGHRIDPPCSPFCLTATDRVLRVPILSGGEILAHCRAQVHSWGKIQEFLHLHLG